MNIIKTIAILLFRFRQKWKWYFQYLKCHNKGYKYVNVVPLSFNELGRVLIVAPHSDDEWIGCYSIIKKTSADVFYCGFLGNDYSDNNKAIRLSEIKENAKYNGYKVIVADESNIESSFIKVLEEGYNSIFIPSPFDWHPEHRLTFKIAYDAINKRGVENACNLTIYYYQISVPHRCYESLYIVEMTKENQSDKWNTFENMYRSQLMPVMRYKLQERLNAEGTAFYSGEIYARPNIEEMRYDYLLTGKTQAVDLDEYRLLINNIFSIREQTLNNKVIWD